MHDYKPKGKHLPIATLADKLCSETAFACDASGRLYVYEGGVFRPTGVSHVARRVKEIAQEWGQEGLWTPALPGSVAEYIGADVPYLSDTVPANILNVRNGLLNIGGDNFQGLELQPHTSEHLSPIQLPVAYDPEAECPGWEEFVNTSFPEDAQELAWEIPAWLISTSSIQKAVILTGEGSNGKSVYLCGLTAFLGRDNVSNVALHQLEKDKFAVADIYGKLANICSDIPATKLFTTSTFKAITGGDLIRGERKYLDAFSFRAQAKLLFSANQLPESNDSTHSFSRRLLILPFERTFDEGANETIPRHLLDRRLADPSELSGLLNKAVAALPRLSEFGFSSPESVRKALADYCSVGNPVAEWLHERMEVHPSRQIEKRAAIDSFNEWCDWNNRQKMTDTGFGRALPRVVTGVKSGQRVIDGKVREVYLGVGPKLVKVFNLRSFR